VDFVIIRTGSHGRLENKVMNCGFCTSREYFDYLVTSKFA